VKIRGAAFTDAAGPAALVAEVERYRDEHRDILDRYLAGEKRDFPGGEDLNVQRRLQHVVLRGGIAYERAVLDWLDDVLATLRDL
jgi:hypothetical protein